MLKPSITEDDRSITARDYNARKAAVVAAENVAGVKGIEDQFLEIAHPPTEDEYGGGDILSLEKDVSTADDKPL
jgi:hypothetical protein